MISNTSHALELLRISTANPNSLFREGQEEAMRFLVAARGRVLDLALLKLAGNLKVICKMLFHSFQL